VAFGGAEYVYLARDEAKRLKRWGLTVIRVDGSEYLGTRPHAGAGEQPACVAFVGEIGRDCGCSIYAGRPRNCRTFEVGSRGCRAAREELGMSV
jgi:Fe-S-cluster containining protein